MAYVDFNAVLPGVSAPIAPAQPLRKTLTPLEWSVVALARRDSLGSLRRPGRLSIALGGLFGTRHNPRLADPALEALRRMAVLSWHHGFAVPASELRSFVASGYSIDQYETMLASIAAAKTAAPVRMAA